jgi:hypothetical protein
VSKSPPAWCASLLLAMHVAAAAAQAGGDPAQRPTSPRRIAAPTQIPDPIVTAPAGEAVQMAAVPRAVRRAVVADAAQRFKVAENAVALVRAEQVTWPDGALGCPEPGRLYTQALVSGYRVVAKTSAGEMLYHTDAGGNVRTCGARGSRASDGIHESLQREAVEPRTQPPSTPLPHK